MRKLVYSEKQLIWIGGSRDDVRAFPEDARSVAGFQLRRIQRGLEPNDWKPMNSVGTGVQEIRIRTELEHRVLYVARFSEGVYVLHAFEKRTRKIRKRDLNIARSRLRRLLIDREMGEMARLKVTKSSGNVFRDVGFSAEEAEHLRVRSDLMIGLQEVLSKRRLKQAEAAKLLGVTQPRISDLMRGRIDLFSADTLIDMLARLGIRVKLVVETSRKRKGVA